MDFKVRKEFDFWIIHQPPDYNQKWLFNVFQSEPMMVHKSSKLKWNQIDPFDVNKEVRDGRWRYDKNLQVVNLEKIIGLEANYFGQVNADGIPHGIGRQMFWKGSVVKPLYVRRFLETCSAIHIELLQVCTN